MMLHTFKKVDIPYLKWPLYRPTGCTISLFCTSNCYVEWLVNSRLVEVQKIMIMTAIAYIHNWPLRTTLQSGLRTSFSHHSYCVR